MTSSRKLSVEFTTSHLITPLPPEKGRSITKVISDIKNKINNLGLDLGEFSVGGKLNSDGVVDIICTFFESDKISTYQVEFSNNDRLVIDDVKGADGNYIKVWVWYFDI